MATAADIRKQIKTLRSALSETEQVQAAAAMTEIFFQHFELKAGQKIGAYLAVNGEMSLRSIIEHAWAAEADVFLPVLCAKQECQLWFAPYHPNTEFKSNRFGIAEPMVCKDELILPEALDMVLTPLVAFDENKHRIGMGGGFYDASFASVNSLMEPKRIACAYEFQKMDEIDAQPWDVAMHHVVTDERLY